MAGAKVRVFWTKRASQCLERIYQYHLTFSQQGAATVREEILQTVSALQFTKQYQVDELNLNFRRMVVRNYKIMYNVKGNEVYITNIFDTRQDPSKNK